MKVKKSALEVVNGMSEREQLALLKFVLNGLTTLTIKQSVETTCANIIGEKNVKVKQVVIEWEEGGSTAFTRQLPTVMLGEIGELVSANKRLESELAETKAHLEQARKELQCNSDADQKKINYWIGEHGKIKKNYNELCMHIKKLVI